MCICEHVKVIDGYEKQRCERPATWEIAYPYGNVVKVCHYHVRGTKARNKFIGAAIKKIHPSPNPT